MRPAELFALIGFVLSILAFNLWRVLPEDWYVYDKTLSLAIVFWLWSIYKYAEGTRRKFKSVAYSIVWIGVVNSIDEFIGKPMDFSVLEFILGLAAIGLGFANYYGLKLKITIKHLWVRKL